MEDAETDRRRGKRGDGVRQWRVLEKLNYKPCLPSLIVWTAGSLENKIKELTALAQSQREYRECSLTCFIETGCTRIFPTATCPWRAFIQFGLTDCTTRDNRKG